MNSEWLHGMEVLDRNECWSLLRTAVLGRLAISIANHPDIFPINYVVDHGTVVFRTAEGTKLAGAVLGSTVAFEVDGLERRSRARLGASSSRAEPPRSRSCTSCSTPLICRSSLGSPAPSTASCASSPTR